MKITVVGLWHLGCVTAACCARHFQVHGLDFDRDTITKLQRGKAPIFEPGLDDLLSAGLQSGTLRFSDDPGTACENADVLWLTHDTPVNEEDESDAAFVLSHLERCLKHLPDGALVLISSQLPAGTCRRLEQSHPSHVFACAPENLRLGRGIETFEKADRIVVGTRTGKKLDVLERLLSPFTPRILWMKTESAEMVKHGLNSFLALSVAFMNEIGRLCERVGADADEVSLGLKSDSRIGPKAYLRAGAAFAGGTLARDVVSLTHLAEESHERVTIIPAIRQSNELHRTWNFRCLETRLAPLTGKRIAILGLTYTPNTDTLRRSAAVELCHDLLQAGAIPQAFDPSIRQLPASMSKVILMPSLEAGLSGVDAAVICTEWTEFKQAPWDRLIGQMRHPILVDANGFLEKELQSRRDIEYFRVGRAP